MGCGVGSTRDERNGGTVPVSTCKGNARTTGAILFHNQAKRKNKSITET